MSKQRGGTTFCAAPLGYTRLDAARRARLEHLELQCIQEHRLQIPLALGQTHPQVCAVPDRPSRVRWGRAGLPGHHRQHTPAHVGVEETRVSLTADVPLDQRGYHPARLSRGRQL